MTSWGHSLRASFDGISIALLLFFHWTRKAKAPLMSVAPMILSASNPVSNGEGFVSVVPFSLESLPFSSSECLASLWFDSFRLGASSFFDFSFSFVDDFSFGFSFSFSFSLSSLVSDPALRFLLSFDDSSFFELTVEPSLEPLESLLMRRFLPELLFAFFA